MTAPPDDPYAAGFRDGIQAARPAKAAGEERRGPHTSEFWLAVAGLVVGGSLVIYGAESGSQRVLDQGAELVQWVCVGYAAARGLAKVGAGRASSASVGP